MEEKTKTPLDPFDVSSEDLKLALTTPAILANRFIVTWDAAGMRLAFGEQISGTETVFRCAVGMSMDSAFSLYQLLEKMLTEVGYLAEESATREEDSHG